MFCFACTNTIEPYWSSTDCALLYSALETPLHYAVRIGQEDIVLALLKAGADVLLCAKDKQAPLDLAQNSRNPNLFRMLSGTTTSCRLL
jgi:hypothetical protein